MNFLGTHDTARILTLLGAEGTPKTKAERAAYRLSPTELARAWQSSVWRECCSQLPRLSHPLLRR